MTTQPSKYRFIIKLNSNYESRYRYNLDEIWEKIKTHYEKQHIPNVIIQYINFENANISPTIQLTEQWYSYSFKTYINSSSYTIWFYPNTTADALIQTIAQFIDEYCN